MTRGGKNKSNQTGRMSPIMDSLTETTRHQLPAVFSIVNSCVSVATILTDERKNIVTGFLSDKNTETFQRFQRVWAGYMNIWKLESVAQTAHSCQRNRSGQKNEMKQFVHVV